MTRLSEAGKFGRFVLVGVVNTAVHYAVYVVAWQLLPYLAAHALAMVVALSCSYLLNCRFTFHVRPRLSTFLLYPASNGVNLAVSTLAMWLLVEVAGVHPLVATLLGGLAATPVTYLVSRLILTFPNRTARFENPLTMGRSW